MQSLIEIMKPKQEEFMKNLAEAWAAAELKKMKEDEAWKKQLEENFNNLLIYGKTEEEI